MIGHSVKRVREDDAETVSKRVKTLSVKVFDAAYVNALLEMSEFNSHKTLVGKCNAVWLSVKENVKLVSKDALMDLQVKWIPFVSLMNPDVVKDRFDFDQSNVCVETLCRPKLTSLLHPFEDNSKVFVWGNKGGGKSHLMNTFAFLKFGEHVVEHTKPRVLWIPHLGEFAANLVSVLFESLFLSFFDSPSDLLEISRIGYNWLNLVQWVHYRSLYLVADNHNALDDDAVGTSTREQRSLARLFVSNCSQSIVSKKVIFCASANQKSVQLAVGKQDGTFKVSVFGGFTANELKILMTKKYPCLLEVQDQVVRLKTAADASPSDTNLREQYEHVLRKTVQWETALNNNGKIVWEGVMDVTGCFFLS